MDIEPLIKPEASPVIHSHSSSKYSSLAPSLKQLLILFVLIKVFLLVLWLLWMNGSFNTVFYAGTIRPLKDQLNLNFTGIYQDTLSYYTQFKASTPAPPLGLSLQHTNSTSNGGIWECKMPDKDPWHADMLPYLNPLDTWKCTPKFVPMTQFNSTTVRNINLLSLRSEFAKEHKCRFKCLYPQDDYKYRPGNWTEVTQPTQPQCDIFEVQCFKGEFTNKTPDQADIYHQIFRPDLPHGIQLELTAQLNTTTVLTTTTPLPPTTPALPKIEPVKDKPDNPKKGKREVKMESEKTDKENAYGIHMVIFDSVSRSNFYRSMQRFVYLLREEYEAIPFHNMNKVAINSLGNAIALLFGKQMEVLPKSPLNAEEIPPDATYARSEICYGRYMDDEPSLILSMLRKLGYKTMMAEDWARGALNWPSCYGFKKSPVDHYMRPFQLRAEENGRQEKGVGWKDYQDARCRETYSDIMNYFKEFVNAYDDVTKKFSLSWMSTLAHDYLNQLYHADNDFYRWFQELAPKLENSFVFVMADHGLRFGGQRWTPTGTMEDNNPFLFISLPKKLRHNSTLRRIMEENSKLLLSHHDTYATLLSIVKESHKWDGSTWDPIWPKPEDIPNLPPMHGSSLFHSPMKQPRDCPSLRIPFSYCQCEQKFVEIVAESGPIAGRLIQDLAQASVDKINKDIADLKYTDKCEKLSIDSCNDCKKECDKCKIKLEEMELQRAPGAAPQDETITEKTYRISFQTTPGGGQFSTSVEFVSEQFERQNTHGDQSKCAVDEPKIQPYCYCKDLAKTTQDDKKS
ncbi:hypothetical protein DdX_10048 [Ditylenchus destructor]|uniref:Uncharacterized protein n=1 Tax=Ditylenchus destructor TaxID=166010 RepID=A0AAD4MZR6_9BILA|nr:hypothetical protein DdX_10048 [Ditylenchus destructor]